MLFHRFCSFNNVFMIYFFRFWTECPEISAHIQELTISVHVSCPNLDVTVSNRDHEECQNWSFEDNGSHFTEFISSKSV